MDWIRVNSVRIHLHRNTKKRIKHVIGLALVILLLGLILVKSDFKKKSGNTVITYESTHWKNKTRNTILLWTDFRGNPWPLEWRQDFANSQYTCDTTDDKSAIRNVDAVLFSQHDIGMTTSYPEYRHPAQVWVLYNMEALTNFRKDMTSLHNVFNWTMTHREDSTVVTPYGRMVHLSFSETRDYIPGNYAKSKNKMAAWIVSHCADAGRRYRIIDELSKYIQIDIYGKCGNIPCPRVKNPVCESSDYKFRIAFENCNCKDYVTEKYWRSLRDGVIPVVNWYKTQKPASVPENSYINLYDFKSVAALGKYLNKVSRDESLYNSYFRWRKYYRPDTRHIGPVNLCNALHNPRPDQTIGDVSGWYKDDICEQKYIWNNLADYVDRFLFDLGW